MKRALLLILGILTMAFAFNVSPANAAPSSGKVTICHVPQGSPTNLQTIQVATKDLQQHLKHGDSLGACNDAACANVCNDGKA